MAAVMVVDDTAFMRMVMRGILEGMGMDVAAEAQNGEEAVRLYEKIRPDLVTMDITMPEMDGIAALKQIRDMDPAAKIIMCSAMGQRDMVLEALRSGAQDFIVKPLQKDRVEQAIQKILQ
ncbi:response regulator [Paenibacillus thalictri]|uniref:Response regulator n=1 Tax=Paenibacillus thalictri TaxID=2527873 RepID=A0A4V2J413_9BACL|nr:response regulator [Paenibacillus thalictri]TBL77283.1 response regulator [Paenibacillus thalictri]